MAEELSAEEIERIEQLAAARGAVRSFEVLPLIAEVRRLRARLEDAEGEGCTLHKHAPHGKEAEQLRKGIENLLATHSHVVTLGPLQRLLDGVDARDSLAHHRANEELRDIRKELGKQIKSRQKCSDILLGILVDNLGRAGEAVTTTGVIRAALVALGHKRAELPHDLPAAGGKRGRR